MIQIGVLALSAALKCNLALVGYKSNAPESVEFALNVAGERHLLRIALLLLVLVEPE